MSGVKGRSGRKHNPRNATRYFNELYDASSFQLAKVTIERALAGDRELLIYCHDRRLGKPKQQTDIGLPGGEKLGAGLLLGILKAVSAERRRLIEGDIKQIEEGKDGGQISGQSTGGEQGEVL